MKIDKSNVKHWLLLVQQACYTLLSICLRPFRKENAKPLIILYGHQLSGNLKALYEQWLLTHSDELNCYFLTLDPEYRDKLKRTGIEVLSSSNLKDMLCAGRCDAMITDHGLHAMSLMVRLTSIKFIDVWHGIPFKGFVPEDFRLQHRYSETWVSSPLLKQIYETRFGFAQEKVISTGYARTDKLFRGDTPINSYRRQAAIPKQNKLVLYAPTWQQNHRGHSLFPFGESQESFIEALSDICAANAATLVIRSHLNAHIIEKQFDNVLYCPMKVFPDTEGLLQETDVLICDWSSIAFDYLALDRPTIFLDVPPPYRNGFSLGPEYRFGEVVQDMTSLREQLASILTDCENYRERRGTMHADITVRVYGEHTDGNAATQQLDRLVEVIAKSDQ
ncbi:MAG: CDP-glycerol glycerophosphotransferase family protein [Halioglobus sp.]